MTKEITLALYCYLVLSLTVQVIAVQKDPLLAHYEPLLPAVTHFDIVTKTDTVVEAAPCYMTTGWHVSACKRRRGVEEKPVIIDPSPSMKFR